MKLHILSAMLALAASTCLAEAGNDGNKYLTSSSSSNSNAAADSASNAVAIASGGSVTFNQPARTQVSQRISGTQTIKSAPSIAPPSMSSGHPCAYAPISVGVSVIGFGGAFGGQRIDDACLLAQMGVQDASISMIAARNPAACRALAAVGRISANACGRGRSAAAPVYRTAVVAKPAPRPAVRRAQLPPQRAKIAPAPRVKLSMQVQQQKKMGKKCETVFATASSKKTVCG